MKKLLLIVLFSCNGFLIAQEGTNMKKVITPPEKVKFTFEKEYPGKTAVWSEEYVGDDDDEVRYEAKFNKDKNTKAVAIYDISGVLKAFEQQISLSKLPINAQAYLKKNYSLKEIEEIAVVVDDKNKTTYEVGVKKDSKFYDVVFDKDGDFNVSIEKN
ncbi:hypothetical protein EYY60_08350 [Flavobacterium zhairuonense]|uniref:hypothetical protein n=1 Tax=Flavobacterium zhairuonense TaxID=2493631 RepID=UPI001053F32C|nr:hypothetical protein [Flavobacterium zhairuonense]KAF2511433.1 hypothetical protein EYY60_08350 [Flavobacterium zhairuonense]